jgi:hypothetical protein
MGDMVCRAHYFYQRFMDMQYFRWGVFPGFMQLNQNLGMVVQNWNALLLGDPLPIDPEFLYNKLAYPPDTSLLVPSSLKDQAAFVAVSDALRDIRGVARYVCNPEIDPPERLNILGIVGSFLRLFNRDVYKKEGTWLIDRFVMWEDLLSQTTRLFLSREEGSMYYRNGIYDHINGYLQDMRKAYPKTLKPVMTAYINRYGL